MLIFFPPEIRASRTDARKIGKEEGKKGRSKLENKKISPVFVCFSFPQLDSFGLMRDGKGNNEPWMVDRGVNASERHFELISKPWKLMKRVKTLSDDLPKDLDSSRDLLIDGSIHQSHTSMWNLCSMICVQPILTFRKLEKHDQVWKKTKLPR